MSVEAPLPENPATRLLDACRAGVHDAALDLLTPDTSLSCTGLDTTLRGPEQIRAALSGALEQFPDLSLQSHTRHVGSGRVIDEARVTGTHSGGENPSGRRLDLPVRVTVRYGTSTSVAVAFPEVLLREALGRSVDRYDLASASVYAVVSAPPGEGMATYSLAEPEPIAPATPASRPGRATPPPPRRRAAAWIAVAASVAVVLGVAATMWLLDGDDHPASPSARATTGSPPVPTPTTTPTRLPTSPTVSPSEARPTSKPNVTLTSDLAFGFDSAELSSQAEDVVRSVAEQARTAGLSGTVFVDGYTDNIGSAPYGLRLSQQRADAVAGLLREQFKGLSLQIIAVGHGETDPVATNDTDDGRQKNRRVTITLPSP